MSKIEGMVEVSKAVLLGHKNYPTSVFFCVQVYSPKEINFRSFLVSGHCKGHPNEQLQTFNFFTEQFLTYFKDRLK